MVDILSQIVLASQDPIIAEVERWLAGISTAIVFLVAVFIYHCLAFKDPVTGLFLGITLGVIVGVIGSHAPAAGVPPLLAVLGAGIVGIVLSAGIHLFEK